MPYRGFIVLDSNVLRNKLDILLKELRSLDRRFRYGLEEHVIIAIPAMVIDEVKENELQVLCKFLLKEEDSEAFLKTLNKYIKRIATEGFTVRVAPIPAIVSACRWGFAYLVGEKDELIMNEMLKMYVTKGAKYYSTLRSILNYLRDKLEEGKEDEILKEIRNEIEPKKLDEWIDELEKNLKVGKIEWEDFTRLLKLCCNVITRKRECQVYGHCKRLVGILPDILIVTSASRLAYVHEDMKVILVTEDKPLCEVVDKVAQKISLKIEVSTVEDIAKVLLRELMCSSETH